MNNGILKIENYEGSITVYFGYPELCNEFLSRFPKSMRVRGAGKTTVLFGNPIEGYDRVWYAQVVFDSNEKLTGGVNETGDKRRARFEAELAKYM